MRIRIKNKFKFVYVIVIFIALITIITTLIATAIKNKSIDTAIKETKIESNIVLANETKYEELTNTGKRNDLKSRFVKEFKAGGMSDSAAVTNADSTINLIMKRKGLSPN